jgi:hypothetical protein
MSGSVKTASPERLTTWMNSIVGLIRTYDEKSMDDGDKEARRRLQARAEEIDKELQRRQSGGTAAPAAPAAPGAPSATTAAPPVTLLKEGVRTKFKNGQVWTLKNGKPERVL